MKITCPMCSQEGNAPDHIHGKKVRCPGCKKVFRVQDEFLVATLPEGLVACSRCHFTFSEVFTQQNGDNIFCSVCAQLSPA